jgi:AcrR family transcriptional regulator
VLPALSPEQVVLERVNRLFMSQGVRSLTMDDVSQELGMSKKTLYKYFRNKRDLVEQVMRYHVTCEEAILNRISAEAENAIDELLLVMRHVSERFASINPSVVYDTRRFYPRSWAVFEGYKNRVIYQRMRQNLLDGIAQGLYRAELSVEVLARVHVARVDLFFDPELFPPGQFTLAETYREFMNYHIRGIASRKGVLYLEKRINREETDGEHG